MKIGLQDNRYGCFTANIYCSECGKKIFSRNFSWSKDHIGMGDKEEISNEISATMERDEIFYCFKCGKYIGE